MATDLDLWQLIASRLENREGMMLLIVTESSGSSPGRSGYMMAVAADGELSGSIGGGLMEVKLVERARAILSEPRAVATGPHTAEIVEQVHQKHSPNASGMICSGRQTVILKRLDSTDLKTVNAIIDALNSRISVKFEISNLRFEIIENTTENSRHNFSRANETDFVYQEKLGTQDELIIIGGGHCALALSEVMSRLDFRIRIFDDRPELNTIAKNDFADDIEIIDSYENIGERIESGVDKYVVVMTLGYASDAIVIRRLSSHEFKYFGVLGSRAKMASLIRELLTEGIDETFINGIKTPIGLPIHSQTPQEIAISIAAEIIAVRNGPISY